jgi:translation initiation factor 2-alpha kinase 4
VTLTVTFTATYPKTAPLLSIKGDGGLRESTKFKIQKVIETKPKELVVEEQAMIMEIVRISLNDFCGFQTVSPVATHLHIK